jgi:ABC-type transporter Mla subunit MlaD
MANLNELFGTNSEAVTKIGSAVRAVADVSGAVAAAVAIADLFISQPNPLQPILDTLQKDFAQLYAALEARQNEEDWRNLAKLVSDAEAVLETLDGLVKADPPLTDAGFDDRDDSCDAWAGFLAAICRNG